jgi:hypothetical protein
VQVEVSRADRGRRSERGATSPSQKLAFGIAWKRRAVWRARAIVDVAPVVDGKPNAIIVFADFVPNNWSTWPTPTRGGDRRARS